MLPGDTRPTGKEGTMSVLPKLQQFLDANRTLYEVLTPHMTAERRPSS